MSIKLPHIPQIELKNKTKMISLIQEKLSTAAFMYQHGCEMNEIN